MLENNWYDYYDLISIYALHKITKNAFVQFKDCMKCGAVL